jgi:hypothetical protein
LSELVAADVRDWPQVIAFRRLNLNGEVIPWPELEGWIQNHPDLKAPLTRDVTVAVEAERLKRLDTGHVAFDPPLTEVSHGGVAFRVLDYAAPDDGWVHRIAVPAGSRLDGLRVLSQSLARTCGWQPAQATVFVVAGVIPIIPTVRTTSHLTSSGGWSARTTLDIDPGATEQDVVKAFRESRAQGRRQRPVTARHARLAVFAMVDHVDKSWDERMRMWNALFPQWTYSPGNFRRDAIEAKTRILREGRHER